MSTAVTDLSERSVFIDKQMEKYERIRRKDDQVARVLTSSSLTQFFVAGLVLVTFASDATDDSAFLVRNVLGAGVRRISLPW